MARSAGGRARVSPARALSEIAQGSGPFGHFGPVVAGSPPPKTIPRTAVLATVITLSAGASAGDSGSAAP